MAHSNEVDAGSRLAYAFKTIIQSPAPLPSERKRLQVRRINLSEAASRKLRLTASAMPSSSLLSAV